MSEPCVTYRYLSTDNRAIALLTIAKTRLYYHDNNLPKSFKTILTYNDTGIRILGISSSSMYTIML